MSESIEPAGEAGVSPATKGGEAVKHTPGEWTADWDDNGQWYVNIGGLSVSGTALRGDSGECVESANARLIAAAPDLYEVLRLMVSPVEHLNGCLWRNDKRMPCQCGFYDRINSAMDQARAAIAKAEGRQDA